MFITIINDSSDDNAKVRQIIRWTTLFPKASISFIGVSSNLTNSATLEAAGNLIDILDASGGRQGIVAVNVAPRGQIKEDGENGSNFSYFWYKKTLIISTTKSYTLSFIKKFEVTKEISLLDTNKVLRYVISRKLIPKRLGDYIRKNQFRSFNFQPRVAMWLRNQIDIPHRKISIEKFLNPPSAIWMIDSFGNAKTTLLPEDLKNLKTKGVVNTNLGRFPYFESLKDIPNGKTAIYTGSSGLGEKRFLEIATQNYEGSAARSLNLKVGKEIELL